jgi:hypothetical protein
MVHFFNHHGSNSNSNDYNSVAGTIVTPDPNKPLPYWAQLPKNYDALKQKMSSLKKQAKKQWKKSGGQQSPTSMPTSPKAV